MKKLTFIIAFLIYQVPANAGWFCEDAASEKVDNIIMSCGIAQAATEEEARKQALNAAFDELDSICERTIDCKTFETLIEPQRNDCRKENKKFKCLRAIKAIITKTKRKEPFAKGKTLQPDISKIDVTVKIDPKDLVVINNGKVEEAKKCQADMAPLSKALLDISSSDKLNLMISEAIKIPFEGLCSSVHYRIMNILERNGIKNQKYFNFLIDTLNKIDDTSADDRSYWTLEHFNKLGPLEKNEWQAALAAVTRAKKYDLYRLMPRIFYDQASSSKQQSIEKSRVDEFAKSILAGKVGRPMPIDFDYGMELFMRSLKSYRTKEKPWLAIYAYDKFRKHLKHSYPDKLHSGLNSLFSSAIDAKSKALLNDFMAENVRKSSPNYSFSSKLVDYIRSFESNIKKLDDEEDDDIKQIKMYETLRSAFIKNAGSNLGENFMITRNDWEKKSRTLLCLEQHIPCGNMIPDAGRLKKLLTSKKPEKRLNALETLLKMPKVSAKLEKEIIKCMNEAVAGKIPHANNIIRSTSTVLAAIPTKNKQALKMMVDLFLNSRLSFQDTRSSLGPNLEPVLLEALKSKNTRHHLIVIRELGENESLQKTTCSYLQTLQKKEQPYFIKDAITKTLEKCL